MGAQINIGARTAETTPLGACIIPLLRALKWHGAKRQFSESLPHFSQINNTMMFRDVMARLDYSSDSIRVSLDELDDRLLPCLFVPDKKDTPMLLLRREDDDYIVFDGQLNKEVNLSTKADNGSMVGTVSVFKKNNPQEKKEVLEESWLRKTFNQNKALIYSSIILSFLINFLALATPLFIMATYDKVIGTSSRYMLGEFTFGVILAFSGYYILFRIRAKLLAVVGARYDRAIGNNIFERLLYLSPIYTESATVGSQVSRIKDFDRLRQFLTGPMVSTFFDLPFIFVALSIIAIIGGSLVIIPFLMIFVFVVIGFFIRKKVRKQTAQAGLLGSQEQEFLLESVKSIKTIKELSVEATWQERFRHYSSKVNLMTTRSTVLSSATGAIADFMMIGAGMAILSFGAIKAINQTITVGGMLAVMILIWRALAPLKTLFNALPRLEQVESSIRQITRLMQIERELVPKENFSMLTRNIKGEVSFSRVSFRYGAAYDPALMGVSFKVKAGELVGVVGRNGSGKSTLLKVLLGLYQPQAGSIRIDNQDIRQLNPIELRGMLAYLPQYPELFYGSIAANLRLAAPEATDEQMEQAVRMAGILDDIKALPEGFNTPIKDYSSSQLPISFQQALCLARAYIRHARIILLDEPGNMLDKEADQQLIRTLGYLRGKATVIMVTHRPSHLKIMDKILLFEQGQLAMAGPAEEVLPKIPKEYL